MYTYVNVYYGLSKAPEHRFFSLEDAIKGLKEIYAKDPFFIDDIKFEEVETVQWKKSVVDENGKENFVPYDVQIRHIKVFLLRKRYEPKNFERVSITPGSQYFSIRYSGSSEHGFGEYLDIKFLHVRGHILYATPFRETYTNNFSPSYDTTHSFNGCNRILDTLEKLRLEGQLHSHHNSYYLSEDLIPSETA